MKRIRRASPLPPRALPTLPAGAGREGGFHLLETIKMMTVVLIVSGLTLPPAWRGLAELRLRWAAEQAMDVLRAARWTAVRRGSGIGVKFSNAPAGGILYALYGDGSGNGVRADVAAGAAPELSPPRRLPMTGRGIRLGFPANRRVRDPALPARYLAHDAEPVRFGDANLAVFDPLGGGARAGALYLTDGERLVTVRVAGGSGALSILAYDFRAETWSR